MSYDPTERAQNLPDQQSNGQMPAQQPPVQPFAEQMSQLPPTQLAPGTPPVYGQSNPSLPQYGQEPQPPVQQAYGQSNPSLPQYEQTPTLPPTQLAPGTPPVYGQSNPSLPQYEQTPQFPPPAYSQSNPSLPLYGQVQPPLDQQYNQSNPSLPQYVQGGPSAPNYPTYPPADPFAPQPPAGAYAPMQPGQPWGMPPGFQQPVPHQKPGGGLKILLIVLVIVVLVVGIGGTAIYFLVRPNPSIQVTSMYNQASTPAGATGTTFALTGKSFSGNSAVTILLDGSPLPDPQTIVSDSSGNITDTLNVTNAWTPGTHTITAKDASGNLTKTGVSIEIVAPGQAGVPGPNGAPPDDAKITIAATIQDIFGLDGNTISPQTLTVSNGGTKVCGQNDDGQPHTQTHTGGGISYTETVTTTCSGTYKGGVLSYTQTDTSDRILADNGVSCTLSTPFVSLQLNGKFSSATEISDGDASSNQTTITCSNGNSQALTPQTGTWTGTASQQ